MDNGNAEGLTVFFRRVLIGLRLITIGLVLFIASRYGLVISRLGARYPKGSKLFHFLLPDWFMAWLAKTALALMESSRLVGDDAINAGIMQARKTVEVMDDDTINAVVAKIEDGKATELLEGFPFHPLLQQMGIINEEIFNWFKEEQFLREHRRKYQSQQ
jgi:hypothetical protein